MSNTQRIHELKTEYAQLHETVLRLFDAGAADNDPDLAHLQRRENAINEELRQLGSHL